MPICKACGEDKKHYGHGLCEVCYQKQYSEQNRTELNKKAKIYRETHRNELNLNSRQYRAEHRNEIIKKKRLYYKTHCTEINIARGKKRHDNGEMSMTENRECSLYLGVHVAERVLSKVFKNVIRMPLENVGYDFICNKGKKIDVKSSCMQASGSNWAFDIGKNKIADMFLLLTFNNRDDLKPLHIWLIPAELVNHRMHIGVSESTLSKWDEYKLDINKVVACCDTMCGDVQ